MTSLLFNATGEKNELTLSSGRYIFQLWGASGTGSYDISSLGTGIPGKGGYIEGRITLKTSRKVFVYVGTVGDTCYLTCKNGAFKIYNGGFNGGGSLNSCGSGGTGGGASDIRFDVDSNESRVIVAGGGGGAGFLSKGGDGGYPTGTDSTNNGGAHYKSNGIGGTQEQGGSQKECIFGQNSAACIETSSTYTNGGFPNSNGGFGNGGNALGRYCGGGGGGGGWYGGGGNVNSGGGGGGSSYVSPIFSSFKYKNGINGGNGMVIITKFDMLRVIERSKNNLSVFISLVTSMLGY